MANQKMREGGALTVEVKVVRISDTGRDLTTEVWGQRITRFNRLMSAHVEDFEPCDVIGLARRFAMRRGYLQNSITEELEQLRIPDEEIKPELREIFIRGVKQGIEIQRSHSVHVYLLTCSRDRNRSGCLPRIRLRLSVPHHDGVSTDVGAKTQLKFTAHRTAIVTVCQC